MKLFVFILTFVSSLNLPKEFINIKRRNIQPLLNKLHSYSVSQFSKTKCSTKEMFISYCRNIREAKYYITQKTETEKENIIFLGWLPLMNDERMIRFRDFKKPLKTNNKANPYLKVPLRNDNNGIPYRKVPYIIVILEKIDEFHSLKIEKILINPTIDLEIDMNHFLTDLEYLCYLSNVKLDTSILSTLDEGRWSLILSESKIL
tara:strand:+ start:950 stop:1561 length:612 start_codon:yes stop_codon:yes gene_type:complete